MADSQQEPVGAGPPAKEGSPVPGAPGDAVGLVEILAGLADLGFRGQFAERDGAVACLTCRQATAPESSEVRRLVRLEGASDPADMLMVVALRCPSCGTQGTLVLNYGPESTLGESDVLDRLPEPPAD